MKSGQSRCTHCKIHKRDEPNKDCRICIDQAMRESFICGILNQQGEGDAFKCQAFQPSLSLVGDGKKRTGIDIVTVCEEKSKYFTEVVDNILYGRCLRNGGCGAYGDKKNGRPIKNRFHVVWVVKERVPLFANSGRYLSYLHDDFLTCGTLRSGKTVLLWLAPDHIHFYLEIPDIEAVGEIVEDLQGIIHDALVEKFIEVRDIAPDDSLLWETSYFLEPID
jgi:REP element-mobilizing transposase RayT